MALDDRERNFEDALARNLQANRSANAPVGTPASAPVPTPSQNSGDCPDAEILAAYHERMLDPEEMILRKQHIASCVRCQEVLAQLEATEEIPLESNREELVTSGVAPVPQAAQVNASRASAPPLVAAASTASKPSSPLQIPRRSGHWRWLVPAGALAAGLLVWVVIHDGNAPQPEFKLAKNQSQPVEEYSARTPSPPADSIREKSAEHDLQEPSMAKVAPSQKLDDAGRDENLMREGARKQKAASPSSVPAVAAPRGDLQSSGSIASAGRAPNPPRVLPPSPSDTKQFSRSNTLNAPGSPSPGTSDSVAVSAAPVPQEAKKEAADNSITATPTLEQSRAVRGGAFALRQIGQPANLKAGRTPVLISSPSGDVTWRLLPAGIIQRSADAGANWTVQKTATVADLLAGSAPSDKTAWVVGRSGTILLTTDGGNQWLKISSPATDDMTSVFAVDAQQATITSAKNISYKTTNGGATWITLPNP